MKTKADSIPLVFETSNNPKKYEIKLGIVNVYFVRRVMTFFQPIVSLYLLVIKIDSTQ